VFLLFIIQTPLYVGGEEEEEGEREKDQESVKKK
jgi:hypothetical protein